MVAGTHSKNTYVELDAVDISTYVNNLAVTDAADEVETTGFGDASKMYASGFRDIAATMGGSWGDPDGTAVGAQLTALRNSGATVELVYGPAGDTAGLVRLVYDAIVLSFDITSAIGAAVTFATRLRLSNPSVGDFS